jgi:hypothetical protein
MAKVKAAIPKLMAAISKNLFLKGVPFATDK